MHPKDLSIDDFYYQLPEGQIAYHPLPQRDAARLLVFKQGEIDDAQFYDLPHYLPDDSLLVFNETKVVHARLKFKRLSGGKVELFCLSPAHNLPVAFALQQSEQSEWVCMIGGKAKWKAGEVLQHIEETGVVVSAKLLHPEHNLVQFHWQPAHLTFAEILHQVGAVPLPPYIKRDAQEEDASRYQTVFARHEGSVAAPTASLHFTEELLDKLSNKGITVAHTTLHVGAGTFAPVKAEKMEEHHMHDEWMEIDVTLLRNLLIHNNRPIIATGTTTLRFLESLYWMGNALYMGTITDFDEVAVSQWHAYEVPAMADRSQALEALITYMQEREWERLSTKTQILIAPGYEIKMADAIITNFHQPGSTLLLLVAAFIGDYWREIYNHALKNNYRFLSYGDGSLLWRSAH